MTTTHYKRVVLKPGKKTIQLFSQQKVMATKGGLDTTRVNHMGVSHSGLCHLHPKNKPNVGDFSSMKKKNLNIKCGTIKCHHLG
jgi:hypothetical protein